MPELRYDIVTGADLQGFSDYATALEASIKQTREVGADTAELEAAVRKLSGAYTAFYAKLAQPTPEQSAVYKQITSLEGQFVKVTAEGEELSTRPPAAPTGEEPVEAAVSVPVEEPAARQTEEERKARAERVTQALALRQLSEEEAAALSKEAVNVGNLNEALKSLSSSYVETGKATLGSIQLADEEQFVLSDLINKRRRLAEENLKAGEAVREAAARQRFESEPPAVEAAKADVPPVQPEFVVKTDEQEAAVKRLAAALKEELAVLERLRDSGQLEGKDEKELETAIQGVSDQLDKATASLNSKATAANKAAASIKALAEVEQLLASTEASPLPDESARYEQKLEQMAAAENLARFEEARVQRRIEDEKLLEKALTEQADAEIRAYTELSENTKRMIQHNPALALVTRNTNLAAISKRRFSGALVQVRAALGPVLAEVPGLSQALGVLGHQAIGVALPVLALTVAVREMVGAAKLAKKYWDDLEHTWKGVPSLAEAGRSALGQLRLEAEAQTRSLLRAADASETLSEAYRRMAEERSRSRSREDELDSARQALAVAEIEASNLTSAAEKRRQILELERQISAERRKRAEEEARDRLRLMEEEAQNLAAQAAGVLKQREASAEAQAREANSRLAKQRSQNAETLKTQQELEKDLEESRAKRKAIADEFGLKDIIAQSTTLPSLRRRLFETEDQTRVSTVAKRDIYNEALAQEKELEQRIQVLKKQARDNEERELDKQSEAAAARDRLAEARQKRQQAVERGAELEAQLPMERQKVEEGVAQQRETARLKDLTDAIRELTRLRQEREEAADPRKFDAKALNDLNREIVKLERTVSRLTLAAPERPRQESRTVEDFSEAARVARQNAEKVQQQTLAGFKAEQEMRGRTFKTDEQAAFAKREAERLALENARRVQEMLDKVLKFPKTTEPTVVRAPAIKKPETPVAEEVEEPAEVKPVEPPPAIPGFRQFGPRGEVTIPTPVVPVAAPPAAAPVAIPRPESLPAIEVPTVRPTLERLRDQLKEKNSEELGLLKQIVDEQGRQAGEIKGLKRQVQNNT